MSVKTTRTQYGETGISKLGQRRQVVIPKEVCDGLGLLVGDFVEVERVKGMVENGVIYKKPPELLKGRGLT